MLGSLSVLILPILIALLVAVGIPAAYRYLRVDGNCRRCQERLTRRGFTRCAYCGSRCFVLRFR